MRFSGAWENCSDDIGKRSLIYLEWLNEVVLVTFQKVGSHLALLLRPFPSDREPAPRHCWCSGIC